MTGRPVQSMQNMLEVAGAGETRNTDAFVRHFIADHAEAATAEALATMNQAHNRLIG